MATSQDCSTGQIVIAAAMAVVSAHEAAAGKVLLAVAITLVVYYCAHVFTRVEADRLGPTQLLRSGTTSDKPKGMNSPFSLADDPQYRRSSCLSTSAPRPPEQSTSPYG